jgi:hypothetical protein
MAELADLVWSLKMVITLNLEFVRPYPKLPQRNPEGKADDKAIPQLQKVLQVKAFFWVKTL